MIGRPFEEMTRRMLAHSGSEVTAYSLGKMQSLLLCGD